MATQTYEFFTPGLHTFDLPANATNVNFILRGAKGGDALPASYIDSRQPLPASPYQTGAQGQYMTGSLDPAEVGGTTLTVYLAYAGNIANSTYGYNVGALGGGGYLAGGHGGYSPGFETWVTAGGGSGGGGASAIIAEIPLDPPNSGSLTLPIAIAGGGGGCGGSAVDYGGQVPIYVTSLTNNFSIGAGPGVNGGNGGDTNGGSGGGGGGVPKGDGGAAQQAGNHIPGSAGVGGGGYHLDSAVPTCDITPAASIPFNLSDGYFYISFDIGDPPNVYLFFTPSIVEGDCATITYIASGTDLSSASLTGFNNPGFNGSVEVCPTSTTTYTYEVCNPVGCSSTSATITVIPPPWVSISASSNPIVAGNCTTLSWNTSGTVDSITWNAESGINNGNFTGSEVVCPTNTTTYTVTATATILGTVYTDVATVTVNVIPPPSISLSASPNPIVAGNCTTLQWDAYGTVDSISWNAESGINNGNFSSSEVVCPLETTTYTVTARATILGTVYTDSATVTIVVKLPPRIAYFRANEDSPETDISPGDVVVLSWSTLFNGQETATAAEIDNGVGGVPVGQLFTSIVSPAETTTYTLTISADGIFAQETVTVNVIGPDDVADTFAFSSIENAELSTMYETEIVTISGLGVSVNAFVTNGAELSVNGGAYSSATQTVSNGDTIRVRMESSLLYSTEKESSISVGVTNTTWSVFTKQEPVNIPNAFSFNNVDDAPIISYVTSNLVTISGLNVIGTVSTPLSGAESSVNGGPFSTAVKLINNGETLALRVLTSNALGDSIQTGVSVGSGPVVVWNVTNVTVADDNPDFFDFVDKIDQPANTFVESDVLTITGINVPTNVIVTSPGQLRVNGGLWNNIGSIGLNDTLQLRLQSSTEPGGEVSTTVTIGNSPLTQLSDDWKVVTTTVGDIVPDAFTFINKDNQPPNTLVYSNAVPIFGITSPSPITISGGEMQINGGPWVTSGSINNGETLRLRITTSASLGTPVSISITVG